MLNRENVKTASPFTVDSYQSKICCASDLTEGKAKFLLAALGEAVELL